MASLWQTLTGKGNRQDSSGAQLTKEAIAEAERVRKEKEAAEAAAAAAAKAKMEKDFVFKKGGMVRSRDGVASKGKTKGRYI